MLLDAGAMELAAEFKIVAFDFPGKTVNQLIVGIHAAPRVTRSSAGLGEKATGSRRCRRKENNRQARRVARCCSGRDITQADRAGIKILVLREESFGEAVPA